ncbi:hypothetical protein SKAU_G00191990 [Synaphobranchus kaupii]|uniref:Uncharacterized protein n=1 Tax=Synaphobranchus kaupii TaxID=118154 RepID=A0A9Q1FE56_SYNKA|nr:hypothetical protein SKAU_G00191990 [Synaphobranchus kaupii]
MFLSRLALVLPKRLLPQAEAPDPDLGPQRLFPPVPVRGTPHCPWLPCGLRAGTCPRAPHLFPSVPDLGRTCGAGCPFTQLSPML